MSDLTINEFGTIKLDGETLLLNGVAIPCGVNNDGNRNTSEMVKRWNSYDRNQELIAKQDEQIGILRDALIDVIDGHSTYDLQCMTGLSESRCNDILKVASKD